MGKTSKDHQVLVTWLVLLGLSNNFTDFHIKIGSEIEILNCGRGSQNDTIIFPCYAKTN
jgi:hypothetical protein